MDGRHRTGEHPAGREFLPTLRSAPWTRAPLLLLRKPIVLLAIAGAALVLAVAAASGILFTATLDSASLQAQARQDCPELSMPTMTTQLVPRQLADSNAAGTAAMRKTGLGGGAYWVNITQVQYQESALTLYARPGALDHVHTLTPNRGQPGVWVPDDVARLLRLRAGRLIHDTDGAPIRIAGIYRSLGGSPFQLANLPRYWCNWSSDILQGVAAGNGPGTPPFLISDVATVQAVTKRFVQAHQISNGSTEAVAGSVQATWYAPVPLASTPVSTLRTDIQRSHDAAKLLTKVIGPRDASGRAAQRFRRLHMPVPPSLRAKAYPQGSLPSKITEAEHVRRGLIGSVIPLDLAGVFVAGLLVAGAGAFWATLREREIALLTARGVSPAQLGVKAALETGPAALVGLAVGVLTSVLLVRHVGPSSVLPAGSIALAALSAAAAVLVGLLVIALVGARAGRDRVVGARRSRWRLLPAELVLLAGAVGLWAWIRAGSAIRVRSAVVHVSPLLLAFPILGATAVVLFAGRVVALVLPLVGRIGRGFGRAGYLALRRIAGSRAVTVGLVVATALPIGLLSFAAAVESSVSHEVTAKYHTTIGAPLSLDVIGLHNSRPGWHGLATQVSTYVSDAQLPGGVPVNVMGIDPATFDRFAYTDSAQRALVRRLSPTHGGAAPAVLVNGGGVASPDRVRIDTSSVGIDVIDRVAGFPGLSVPAFPLLVVDNAVLDHVDTQANRTNLLWTDRAHLPTLSRRIQHSAYEILAVVEPQVIIDTTGLLPVTWIFGYLRAIAFLIGAVALSGLVFALAARARRRRVSYVMSRRMGLTRLMNVRSSAIELTVVLGFGWLLGAAVGVGGFAVLVGSLDVYPSLAPPAAFGLPTGVLLVTALVVLACVLLGALVAQWLADRADPADVLRLE